MTQLLLLLRELLMLDRGDGAYSPVEVIRLALRATLSPKFAFVNCARG
jgi:hypothetical protein